MIKKVFLVVIFLLACNTAFLQVRSVVDFNNGWKFYLGDDSLAANANYSDAKWRNLNLPHDWSIEQNFSSSAPATNQGGSLPGGIGWYRKTFTVSSSVKNKITTIVFDGVYKNSEVWINGHYLGKRPYGYTSFSYDLTAYMNYDKQNVIAVKVDNSLQPDSRWYTGSGIYRDVKLITSNPLSLKEEGVFITTPKVSSKEAVIKIESQIRNDRSENIIVNLYTDVFNKAGKKISSSRNIIKRVIPAGGYTYTDELKIVDPQLWSATIPYLYKAVTKIEIDGKLIDAVETTFGIRSFYFDSQKGFFLNNQPLKIHGVCMHHDLGALGAAFNKVAAKRQLTILKEMGCNVIRFAHNPPASTMLDLCDEMGFLVIDEAYDIWKKKKNKYDYHQYFDEWAVTDAQAMVMRDRNHPSVIMWSIGNEQREQFDSTGTIIVKKLVAAIKSVDTTRPVTTALTETFPEKNFITQANALDVLGFNYKLYDYEALPKRFPNQKFIATETASALETRGVYQFPADSIRIWPPDYKAQDTFADGNKDFTCSGYDNTHAYWGATHEKSWLAVKTNQHIAGLFVWSGFDYLGEPLPYPKYPARSSYYGIIDLAGFPKDVYYMYQSEWTSKPVLHLFPHWNWSKGDTVDVWAYYNNADEVELYLNGKSLGKRSKTDTTLHVSWKVVYEPGTLKVVSRKNGIIVLTKEIKTAGLPAKIELIADRKSIKANGKDLAFVTVRVVDKNGRLVPDADKMVEFTVTGTGFLAGTDNGYQADTTSLKSNKRKTWKGLALVMVQSDKKQGNITVIAKSAGLKQAVITLKTEE